MKRLILMLSIVLVGCNTNGDDHVKDEEKAPVEETSEDRKLYIVSFNEYVEDEDLESYGIKKDMIDGDMKTLKMKSIYMTEDEKKRLETLGSVKYIEENGEVGIPEGPSEKNDDAK